MYSIQDSIEKTDFPHIILEKPEILCVIPSRLASTRLLEKPLALIRGKPLVQWVYESALACSIFSKVIVATDDERVANALPTTAHVELTPSSLPTGTDRVAAVASLFPQYEVVVNFQGDTPFVPAEVMETLVAPYLEGEMPDLATLCCPLDPADYANPNSVKVITNYKNNALYFSRAPIPYFRAPWEEVLRNNAQAPFPVRHHLGLYAFRRNFLLDYPFLPQGILEQVESLEQLRALEHGYQIRVSEIPYKVYEVNTPEDLAAAQNWGTIA